MHIVGPNVQSSCIHPAVSIRPLWAGTSAKRRASQKWQEESGSAASIIFEVNDVRLFNYVRFARPFRTLNHI
jgi:hypothetical protein